MLSYHRHLIKCLLISVCWGFVVVLYFRVRDFLPPSLKHFLRAREKAQGFVRLFCGVVAAGRRVAGDGLSPSASLRRPFGRRQIVWAASPGDGGMWLPPGWGQPRQGSSARAAPSSPAGWGRGRRELSNWRAFHLFVFTVINPSERAASVALGSAGGGERRAGPRREGGALVFVAFRELCCHSNGAF